MADTFRGIAGKVLLRCSAASQTLAQDWVRSAFRDLVERRRWSWLLKRGQLLVYDQYATGTATVVAGTQTVTILAPGVVAAAHVGRQFRIGSALPIVTIIDYSASANTYTIDQVWWPSNQTAQAFAVYQAYVALPSDFHSFVSIVDPASAQSIDFDGSAADIDKQDPQRAAAGSPPVGVFYFDYFNGLPRYEMWPHQRSAAIFPILYESRPVDPFETGAAVPALCPDDIILERAMMYCALWPGTETLPNPYFVSKLGLAQMHKMEYERRVAILEKQDNEHMQQNIWYQSDESGNTGIMSSSWMQSHGL